MAHSLVDLYKEKSVNQLSGFSQTAAEIEVDRLADAYAELREVAPKRHASNRSYLAGRDGVTSSGRYSNRREEHLAVALCNASQEGASFTLPDGAGLEFIDYQTPLKARRNDRGVGKVDILGVVDGSALCVIELKIQSQGSSLGDTPLRAYLEGLAYCAIIEANAADIAKEVEARTGHALHEHSPVLVVMAPEEYWLKYLAHKRVGDWWPVIQRLADQVQSRTRVETRFVAIQDCTFAMGLEGKPPKLTGQCRLVGVSSLNQTSQNRPNDANG